METVDQIPVALGLCPCEGTPHAEGDTVYLRAKLGLSAGIAIQKLVLDANRDPSGLAAAQMTGILAEGYLLYGVAAWTLTDARGKPIPVSGDTIRTYLLDDFAIGSLVAEQADTLYMGPVILPLVQRAAKSSATTPINGSISPTSNGSVKKPRRRKPSSTSTSQTGVTAQISG